MAFGADLNAAEAAGNSDEPPLYAYMTDSGEWVCDDDPIEARRLAHKVQGRRTTQDVSPPLDVPVGDWDVTLQTSFVEPGYLETDSVWCAPGGEPSCAAANGGAFGGKAGSVAAQAAKELADRHRRPVLARMTREDTVRFGAKRPPLAAGIAKSAGGLSGVVRFVDPLVQESRVCLADLTSEILPGVAVDFVEVSGISCSLDLRCAGRAELYAIRAALNSRSGAIGRDDDVISGGDVGWSGTGLASVTWDDGFVVRVDAGAPLDRTMLRSYCIGAVHMAASLVWSESLATQDNRPVDLTIRSFGILSAKETPHVTVEIEESDAEPVAVSDAVFVATVAEAWRLSGWSSVWPTGIPSEVVSSLAKGVG